MCVCVCVCVCPRGHKTPAVPSLREWRVAIKVGRPSPKPSLKLGRRTRKKLCSAEAGIPAAAASPESPPRAGAKAPWGGVSSTPPLPQARPLPAPGLLRLGGLSPGPDTPLGSPRDPTPHLRIQAPGLRAPRERSPGREGSGSFVFLFLRG